MGMLNHKREMKEKEVYEKEQGPNWKELEINNYER